jgi:FKBP-type peptidyl-prolyl cis-trans isomerase 2
MFATNKQESINQLVAHGLNTSYEWTTEPLKAKIGNGDIMESLEIALEGCHEGDSVEVYLTFESAYGHNHIGMVPSKSAQVWYIDIKSVTKK